MRGFPDAVASFLRQSQRGIWHCAALQPEERGRPRTAHAGLTRDPHSVRRCRLGVRNGAQRCAAVLYRFYTCATSQRAAIWGSSKPRLADFHLGIPSVSLSRRRGKFARATAATGLIDRENVRRTYFKHASAIASNHGLDEGRLRFSCPGALWAARRAQAPCGTSPSAPCSVLY